MDGSEEGDDALMMTMKKEMIKEYEDLTKRWNQLPQLSRLYCCDVMVQQSR